jgi:hypothetical protein
MPARLSLGCLAAENVLAIACRNQGRVLSIFPTPPGLTRNRR